MLQRFILGLRQKELINPTAFVLALLLVLSIIIILGQFFHQSLQEEMAEQFNKQQLLLSREVAMNIESFIDHSFKDILIISRMTEVSLLNQGSGCSSVADAINLHVQNEALITISVVDKHGIIRCDSTFPRRIGRDISRTDYYQRARVLPNNEKLVTDLLEAPDPKPEAKQFIIATPIYRQKASSGFPAFEGIVFAVLSLEGITHKYIEPIRSGARGFAWMLDSDGTLLFHPKQPQMVGKNLYQTDRSCFECHRSFESEKRMIEGTTEQFGSYEAPGGENKLAAFYKFPIARKSWIVVVSAPYSEVTGLMQKSRIFYSLLIVSILITTLVASGALIVNYKTKIEAEEKAKHYENQRRLEREIEIQKDYLENIVEHTKTNLMVLDKNLTVRTLNTAQAQTLGKPKQEVLGRSFFSLFAQGLQPYEHIPMENILQQALSGGHFEIKDYEIRGLQEYPMFLAMNISPLLIDGKTPGVLITSTDVTKRVQLEDALKQYTVELEDKVDKGTATARKLEQQVMHSEKLAALGRIAAGVAHEIGNPLTSISTFAQMLRELAADEFSQSSLDIINNHIQRITDIVRRMSTFARADALNIKRVQINDAVKSTLDLMRLDKRMKLSIKIEVSLAPDLPLIMIDEGQMSQVFINIFLNALDAMPDGGLLTIESHRGIDDQGHDSVMVSFSDTGTGIPREDLQKIFDPFYTTKEAGKGTGLGLSLSYNIVKRFRGDIKVESEIGKGTTFTIILPIDTGQEATETTAHG